MHTRIQEGSDKPRKHNGHNVFFNISTGVVKCLLSFILSKFYYLTIFANIYFCLNYHKITPLPPGLYKQVKGYDRCQR